MRGLNGSSLFYLERLIFMKRKIPAIYIYNSETGEFNVYHNLTYETVDFTHKFDGTNIHAYGRDYAKNIRIEIARHEEEIFHNRLKHEYVVYLTKDNEDKAIKLLSDYVLGRIEIEISYLEKQLSIATEKHKRCEMFRDRETKKQIIED